LDPVGKRFWPFFKGRDGCRSPMQWDDSPQAGFMPSDSQRTPWLPVHTNHTWRNVMTQRGDPGSLFNFYRRLIALRRSSPALTQGMFLSIAHGSGALLAYLRQTRDQTILVALNFSHRPQRLVLGNSLARVEWQLLLSSHRDVVGKVEVQKGLLALGPDEALIAELAR